MSEQSVVQLTDLELTTDPSLVLVVSAPSGAGKSTICRELLDRHEDVVFSVSTTTRSPRVDEREGEDYYFVDDDEFDQMVAQGEFLEWANVHGECYGTSRQAVLDELAANRDVVLDIDVQGARQIKEILPTAVLIFIVPPSMDELERRLNNRDTETEEEIKKRLTNARREIQSMEMYDYVVVNDEVEEAVADLECIRTAEKNRLTRRTKNGVTNSEQRLRQ